MAANESRSRLLSVLLRAELPAQVLSRRFEQYLFFDADISTSEPMISAVYGVISRCFGSNFEAEVFASASREFVARLGRGADWQAEIVRVGKVLRDAGDFGGLILVDTKLRWVVCQSRPVDVGVCAIDSHSKLQGVKTVKEDFFDCTDISGWLMRQTARDIDLVQGFGAEFLTALAKNYQ